MKILAYIPARSGSKRVPNKNIKNFVGKPLIAHTIELALASPVIDKVFVDTDSKAYAKVAEQYGVAVPWLRPKELASDSAQVIDSIIYTLDRLKKEQKYEPDYLMILQTTSPLRELSDINACVEDMKKGGATSVITVSPTHPRIYHLDKDNFIELGNKEKSNSSNTQDWKKAYLLNGCIVYLTDVKALREEKTVLTEKTRAVITPKWRAVDIDDPDDWVMAELIFNNKKHIDDQIKKY